MKRIGISNFLCHMASYTRWQFQKSLEKWIYRQIGRKWIPLFSISKTIFFSLEIFWNSVSLIAQIVASKKNSGVSNQITNSMYNVWATLLKATVTVNAEPVPSSLAGLLPQESNEQFTTVMVSVSNPYFRNVLHPPLTHHFQGEQIKQDPAWTTF